MIVAADQLWRNDRKAALEKRAIHEEESVHHRALHRAKRSGRNTVSR